MKINIISNKIKDNKSRKMSMLITKKNQFRKINKKSIKFKDNKFKKFKIKLN